MTDVSPDRGGLWTRFRRRKYGVLLSSLGLLIVVFPLLREALATRLLFDLLATAIFVAAVLAVFSRGATRAWALSLGLPTLIGLWTDDVLPGLPAEPVAVAFHGMATLFLAFTTAFILRALYVESRVTGDSICGAFCGYLLVGLAFGHVDSVIEIMRPGSFSLGGVPFPPGHDLHDRHFLLSYYSFLTLTTIGYGDVLPVSDAARGVAVVEGILGQFYIAVLVAELLSRKVAYVMAKRTANPPPPNDDVAPRGRS